MRQLFKNPTNFQYLLLNELTQASGPMQQIDPPLFTSPFQSRHDVRGEGKRRAREQHGGQQKTHPSNVGRAAQAERRLSCRELTEPGGRPNGV